MAIDITCTGCQSVYPVAENLIGKTIRCKKCGEMMPVTAPVRAAKAVAARPARPAARIDDDEDDVVPARSASRRARDEDDEARDHPRKKSALPLILAGGVVLLLVLGGGGAAAVFGLGLLDGKTDDTVASNSSTVPNTPFTNQPPPVEDDTPNPTAPTSTGQPKTNGPAGTQPTKGGAAASVPPPLEPVKTPITATPTPGLPPARDTLDLNTLNKCKNATVFFDVESKFGGKWTGSGWFGLESNLIFTNAHVVGMTSRGSPKPAKMTVYLNSGTPQQREIPHSRMEILAVDREADLAVIKVLNESDLPSPLQVRPSADLPELEKAVILGFPGGYTLSRITKSDKQPAVTVNPSSVGAVRRDTLGNLSGVQFRGGSARGGSGGPIVDMNGNVIAVLFMGPSDAILASAACYGVPTEYVTGLVAGRVAEVEYGQAYRKDGKVHIPVTARCLDPFNRLKQIGVGFWVGDNNKRTRAPGLQRTGMEPSDADYREVVLTYKHSKDDPVATGELVLPELTSGRSYWAQPFYTNALVTKQWLAGNPIALSGPPVDLEPADLFVRYKPGVVRKITLSNASSLEEIEESEEEDQAQKVLVEVTTSMNEAVQRPAEQGAHATLAYTFTDVDLKAQIGSVRINIIPKDMIGLFKEGIKQVQASGYVNREGEIYRTFTNVRATGQFANLFKVLSDDSLESLRAGSIRIPNTKANPGFSWTDKRSVRFTLVTSDGSELLDPAGAGGQPGPGGRPAARRQPRTREYKYQEELKYTYLGTRMRAGSKEAVVKVEGTITTPPGVKADEGASGVLKGVVTIDLDTGMVLSAEIDKELQLDSSSQGLKKRVSGVNKYRLTRGAAVTSTGT